MFRPGVLLPGFKRGKSTSGRGITGSNGKRGKKVDRTGSPEDLRTCKAGRTKKKKFLTVHGKESA